MSAYATVPSGRKTPAVSLATTGDCSGSSILDALIEDVVERVAAAVILRLGIPPEQQAAEWLDSRTAAEYLGVHRDTLRKLAAERSIPSHQDGRGCELFFRRQDLDVWRRSGGRAVHLSSVLAKAA